MGTQLASGSMNVNNQIAISGVLVQSSLGSNQTDISQTVTKTNTGTVLTRTNTSGKIAYINSITCGVYSSGYGGTAGGSIVIKDNATVKWTGHFVASAAEQMPKQFSFICPLQFSTSIVITYTANGGTDLCEISLQGFEQ